MGQSAYYVYILSCEDDSLYTGITPDLKRRLALHNAGKASKYTAPRLPVRLVYVEPAADRSEASKREYAIKQLARGQKLALIEAGREVTEAILGAVL